MHVTVDACDIAMGSRGAATDCPIAIALKRYVTANCSVHVRPRNIVLIRDRNTSQELVLVLDLPLEAQQFIGDFDLCGHRRVAPFTFHLSHPALSEFARQTWPPQAPPATVPAEAEDRECVLA